MDREHDDGPQAPVDYPGNYRPHQTATPEINRHHQNYQEDNLAHPSRQGRFPFLEVRRYETRQYGAAAYAQAQNTINDNNTPRNLHYSERLNQTRYSQRGHYDMRERRAENDEYPVENTRIYLRSISTRNSHPAPRTFWTLDPAPDRWPLQMRESWAGLEFTLNLSLEKNHLGFITKKFAYLHCTPRSSNDRACLRFDLFPRREVNIPNIPNARSPSSIYLQLYSPGVPSGTESIQEDNWRTILKDIHIMVLRDESHPSGLQLELDSPGDVETILSFFWGQRSQKGTANGGALGGGTLTGEAPGRKKKSPIDDSSAKPLGEPQQKDPLPPKHQLTNIGISNGGASAVKKRFPIAGNDIETPRGPRQKNSFPRKNMFSQKISFPQKNSLPQRNSTPQNPRFTQNGTANSGAPLTRGASGVKTKFPDESDIEKPGQKKRKKPQPVEQEPEVAETSVSDSERPRQTKKKKREPMPKPEPRPEQERKIPVVSSDTESPEDARQRKKKKPLPSKPERTEAPQRKKKKKSLSSQPQRKAPVSDSDSPEEPRRKKKKMILPSGRERKIAVDSDSDSDTPEERRQRKKKKARPSKPRQKAPVDSDSDSPEEQRVKKKKKPQAPIVLSDSDAPEEPKRKKKKSRPSEPEPAPPAPRGRKPKEDKARHTPKVPQSERTKSKGKNKQTPPPSPPRSPSPDPRTPPSNDTNLDSLQKRLAEINSAKNELYVEELEVKAKLLRQKIASNDGKSLGNFTCSACGEYGHRKDSWKCEKHPSRRRVLG
jgi:hypothetical protein